MPVSEIIRFLHHQFELLLMLSLRVVTPASAIRAISKIIRIFEFVARSVLVDPAHTEINSTMTKACEMVIVCSQNFLSGICKSKKICE